MQRNLIFQISPLLKNPEITEGSIEMGAQNKMIFNDQKSVPKQIPLFEEQDDGNLTPYVQED